MGRKHSVRVRNGFSDRNGMSPISKEIQSNNINAETRIVLYNVLKNAMEIQINSQQLDRDWITKVIVEKMFNEQYSEYSTNYSDIIDDLYDIFINEEYHVVLTVIEFICDLLYESRNDYLQRHGDDWFYARNYIDMREQMNESFEDEFVGYRFVDEKIIGITNEEERKLIEESTQTPFEKVNESIVKSITFLSETGNKDYKNSIKESITAVEQLFNILLGKEGLTLSNALEQLCQKISIDDNLKASIKSLYSFASDANGVRHGNNKNNGRITFEEAKLILLICSATINYFVSKKID